MDENLKTPVENFNSLALKVKKSGDDDAYMTLTGQYSPMCYSVIEKYKPALQQSGIYFGDFSEKIPGLIFDACRSFDPKKASFSTHLYNTIRYDCLNNININANRVNIRENLSYLGEEFSKNHNTSIDVFSLGDDYNEIIKQIKQLEDKRIFKIFKYRFLGKKSLSLKVIGKKMKLSSQTIHTLLRQGIEQIRKKNNIIVES